MRKPILIILVIIGLNLHAQKFKYNAMMAQGLTVKTEGTIEITDSLLIITSNYKSETTTNDYDIINIRNNITYVTDGVSTHHFNIVSSPGKRKGKKYDKVFYFSMNINGRENLISYYITEETN